MEPIARHRVFMANPQWGPQIVVGATEYETTHRDVGVCAVFKRDGKAIAHFFGIAAITVVEDDD